MFYSTASLIWDLSLEMPADEKAHSGLMLDDGVYFKDFFWTPQHSPPVPSPPIPSSPLHLEIGPLKSS